MLSNIVTKTKKSLTSTSNSQKNAEKVGKENAYEWRRAQVRRAQRTHRERKANYVKALEQEVVSLRRRHQQDIREREEEIAYYRQTLLNHGIVPPPRPAPQTIEYSNLGPLDGIRDGNGRNILISKEKGTGPLHVHMPQHQLQQMDLDPRQEMSTMSWEANSLSPGTSSGMEHGTSVASVGSPWSSSGEASVTTAPNQYDGVEFVLALEHPCLSHPDVTREEYGTHSHMASNQLLVCGPSNLSAATSWEVPDAGMERLLALSQTFHLQGELTPVQAWHKLQDHGKFNRIGKMQLERLKSMLWGEVKCYGFGSVMDEQIWDVAIEEITRDL